MSSPLTPDLAKPGTLSCMTDNNLGDPRRVFAPASHAFLMQLVYDGKEINQRHAFTDLALNTQHHFLLDEWES